MITIHQIPITNSVYNAVNAGNTVPSFDVKRKLQFSPTKKWEPEFWDYFCPVYEVETDDLEKAFELTNLWNNGHLIKALEAKGHSSSVGDLFELDGKYFIVDSFGFKEVDVK